MKNQELEVILSPKDPTIGYSPQLGEFALSETALTPDQRGEIDELKENGFSMREVDAYIKGLVIEELLAQKSKASLEEAENNLKNTGELLGTEIDEFTDESDKDELAEEQKLSEESRTNLEGAEESLKKTEELLGNKIIFVDDDTVEIEGMKYGISDNSVLSEEYKRRKALRLHPKKVVNKNTRINSEDLRVLYELRNSDFGQEAIFEGMQIPKDLRDKELGGELFDLFLKFLKNKDIQFSGTNCIRKPLIALILQRKGLVPELREQIAVILPKNKKCKTNSKQTHVRVFISGDEPAKEAAKKEAISKNGRHVFYEVVSTEETIDLLAQLPEEEKGKYLIKHTVPLNTRWIPRASGS